MVRLDRVWLFALLVFSPACKDREDPGATGTKVTAESDYDATEPIVDDDYRFRIVSPGPGWKLLRTVDMRRLLPDAVAGAMSSGGEVIGGVIVERLPGATLEQAVELVGNALPQAILESGQDVQFEGLAAHRRVFTVEIGGANYRYVSVVFLRGEYLYQVLAWGRAASTEVADLEPFFTAFSLTEGEIRNPTDDRPPVTQADGVTWQIRKGEFRSVISGLSLVPAGGWRYLVGRELYQINPEAELALSNAELGAYFVVITERYGSSDPAGLVATIKTRYEQNVGPAEPELTREVAGHSVAFSRHRMDNSLEFLVGVIAAEGAVTQLVTWYPQAEREPSLAAFEQVLRGITKLSEPQREQLSEQLLARKGVVRKATPSSAFLDEEFRDFAHALTWTQPRGLYIVHMGDELLDKPTVVLEFEAPLEGVYAQLEVIEGDGARVDALHEEVAGGLDRRRDEQSKIDGVAVSKSFGAGQLGETELHYGVLSASHQSHAVILTVWTPTFATSSKTVEAALDGLHLPATLPETSELGERFLDHQFGISVQPPSGWPRRDATPISMGAGRVTEWKQGRSELTLVTLTSELFTDDEDWLASFMEQTLRDVLAAKAPQGKPESTADSIDGRPSRRLVYPDAQVEVVAEGNTITLLIMIEIDDDAIERFRRSVRWTDE